MPRCPGSGPGTCAGYIVFLLLSGLGCCNAGGYVTQVEAQLLPSEACRSLFARLLGMALPECVWTCPNHSSEMLIAVPQTGTNAPT